MNIYRTLSIGKISTILCGIGKDLHPSNPRLIFVFQFTLHVIGVVAASFVEVFMAILGSPWKY